MRPQPRITRGVKFSSSTSACVPRSSHEQLAPAATARSSASERLPRLTTWKAPARSQCSLSGSFSKNGLNDRARLVEAMRRLDLDHLGAEVCEQSADVGRREDVGEIEHAQACRAGLSPGCWVALAPGAGRERVRRAPPRCAGRGLARGRGSSPGVRERFASTAGNSSAVEPRHRAQRAPRAQLRAASSSAAPRTSPQSNPSREASLEEGHAVARCAAAPDRSSTSSAACAARPRRGRETRVR